MQYREDKKSGNQLSVLGFGCMRFPRNLGQIDVKKTEQLINKAIERGVNYFDTAYLYPGSEETLGAVLKKNGRRPKVYIATKLPFSQCKRYEDFDKFFEIQKKRLQTDYIDYYFIHAISDCKQWERLCELGVEQWIAKKKAAGEIRQVGFSFHGLTNEFIKLVDAYDWDFCQIQYNYINVNYQAGETGLKKAAEKGLSVFVMEPLLGGKLANGLPPKTVALLKKVDEKNSPAAWALNWLWNQPEVTLLLSGMNGMEQVRENTALAHRARAGMFGTGENKVIDKVIEIFNESYKVPCTGCNYCMPCPKGINIPACFAAYNATFAFGKFAGLQQYVLSTGGVGKGETHYAGDCVKCGKCERHCPQHIQIRKELQKVSRRMESFWLKPGLRIMGKVMDFINI